MITFLKMSAWGLFGVMNNVDIPAT